jgi:hypothetical protein
MRLSVTRILLALAGISIAARAGSGFAQQAGEDLVTRAVRAYADLDLETAVGFLQRWLVSDGASGAPLEQRRRAYTYLGAAETLRGNPDEATAAFERLVELDPRARLDQLVFPPEVTAPFEAVRARTKVVWVSAPALTDLRPDGESFQAWLFASSPHQVRVTLRRAEGNLVRLIYQGIIGDSLNVGWDGRDSSGAWVSSGAYLLEAFSSAQGADPQRVMQLPLAITQRGADTLSAPDPPADSLLLPERRGAGPGVEALVGGLLLGAGIAILPPQLAQDASAKPLRFAVAGSIGLAGLVGYFRARPGGILAENRQANDDVRRAWRERVAAVAELNRARRAEAGVVIRAGQPTLVRLPGP